MIVKQKWSLYAMLSLLDTRFISNPEIVLCFISVIIILMTLSIYTYSTSYCLNSMFSKENNNNIITNIFIIVLLFITTMYISSKYSIYELLYFKQIYPIMAIILILMCLIKKEKCLWKKRGVLFWKWLLLLLVQLPEWSVYRQQTCNWLSYK